MARVNRIFAQNACNHIVARSSVPQGVFLDDEDYRSYIKLVHKYKLKFGCLIYCYCFMLNHIHMLLESPLGLKAMSSFMHGINQSYAMRFNNKYGKFGHVWQNRYKNFIVLKDSYLLNLINYIEHNPVRANVVTRAEDYPWSSYRGRVLGYNDIILDTMDAGACLKPVSGQACA
jgi:putative transposase